MTSVVADTHAILWHLLRDARLSAPARQAMRGAVDSGNPIFIASISVVEVTYLVEKGRIPAEALQLLRQALRDFVSGLALVPLDRDIADAIQQIPRDQVPDLPDRVIAATALVLNLPLVSRDRRIQSSIVETIW
jgi:PIN domain nuclease of toxin-antitoxin system